MEVRLVVILCFAVLGVVINAKNVRSKPGATEDIYGDMVEEADKDVQNDDYEYPGLDDPANIPEENEEARDEIIAEFKTKPQTFTVKIGDVVRLPCEVTNPDDVIIMWIKDETELLYQGDLTVKKVNNINKINNSLEVNITSERDFGKYSCKMAISDDNSPKVVHTVARATPPRIISIEADNNKTVYKIGETLTLTCIVDGAPKPKISWHRDSERLGTEGETITIPNLKPRNSGTYRCLADNDIKPPAHHHINIYIEHKPIVSIEKYLVNSDHEKDAELKCTVHAYPTPVVIWKKNGVNVVAAPPRIMLKRHQNNIENILLITNVTEEDFGNYTCQASNQIDRVEKHVMLVKTPTVREFIKPEKANKEVVLTWKVESKSPIIEHELQYRRKGDDQWKNAKPEVTSDGNEIYTVRYTLKNLEAGSYETRTRSQNKHGWSEYSEIVPFEGVSAKNGYHHKPHKKHHKDKDMKEKQGVNTTPAPHTQEHESPLGEKQAASSTNAQPENESAVGASKTSGCTSLVSSMYLLSIAMLIVCQHHRQ